MSSYRFFAVLVAAASFWGLWFDRAAAGEARVEIELAMERTYIATSQQQWYRLFADLGIDNLRIRKALPGEKAELKTEGAKGSPVYRVTGLLRAGDQLVLPGGKYGLGDGARLAEWLKKLRAEGPQKEGAVAPPFHLDNKQFAAVKSDLRQRVGFSTKGLTPSELLSKLSATLAHRTVIDRLAKQPLAADEPIEAELQGLTSGTALAYALRGAGLGLEPRQDTRKQVEYAIVKPVPKQMIWPVGWTLRNEKPRDVLPGLYETINVDIDDYPLDEALMAVAGKLDVPILYDRYALERHGIEVSKVKVTFQPGKSWYSKIIDKLLHQAGLNGEWRLDDAGKPLLWVTTLKPVR